MMLLSEPDDRAALSAFCDGSLCGTYILCRYLCYGNQYPFARCYVDCVGDTVCTALSVLEDTAVLLAGESTDFEELGICLPMLGIRRLMTEDAFAQKLPFPCVVTRQALRFTGNADDADTVCDAPMRRVYDLISASIPDSFSKEEEAYLHFLSDFSFRRNRGFARLKAVLQDDSLIACALTAAETPTAAVISGVACRSDRRGSGYGKAVVHAMCADFKRENKTAYVIALHDDAVGFYQKIVFEKDRKITWFRMT